MHPFIYIGKYRYNTNLEINLFHVAILLTCLCFHFAVCMCVCIRARVSVCSRRQNCNWNKCCFQVFALSSTSPSLSVTATGEYFSVSTWRPGYFAMFSLYCFSTSTTGPSTAFYFESKRRMHMLFTESLTITADSFINEKMRSQIYSLIALSPYKVDIVPYLSYKCSICSLYKLWAKNRHNKLQSVPPNPWYDSIHKSPVRPILLLSSTLPPPPSITSSSSSFYFF